MDDGNPVSRRRLLLGSVAATAALGSRVSPARAEDRDEQHHWALRDVTPATVAGPFYPLRNKPVHFDVVVTNG